MGRLGLADSAKKSSLSEKYHYFAQSAPELGRKASQNLPVHVRFRTLFSCANKLSIGSGSNAGHLGLEVWRRLRFRQLGGMVALPGGLPN